MSMQPEKHSTSPLKVFAA